MNLIYDCWSSAGGEMYIPDAEKLNLSSNAWNQLIYYLGSNVSLENSFYEQNVFIVCDSSPVVDFTSQIVYDLVRNVVVFIQKYL